MSYFCLIQNYLLYNILQSRHKQKIVSKESEIQGVRREMMKLERAITDATDSKQKLDVLQEKLDAAEK